MFSYFKQKDIRVRLMLSNLPVVKLYLVTWKNNHKNSF